MSCAVRVAEQKAVLQGMAGGAGGAGRAGSGGAGQRQDAGLPAAGACGADCLWPRRRHCASGAPGAGARAHAVRHLLHSFHHAGLLCCHVVLEQHFNLLAFSGPVRGQKKSVQATLLSQGNLALKSHTLWTPLAVETELALSLCSHFYLQNA